MGFRAEEALFVVSTLDSKDAKKVLKKCFKMNIYSQKLASRQPRKSPPTFGKHSTLAMLCIFILCRKGYRLVDGLARFCAEVLS